MTMTAAERAPLDKTVPTAKNGPITKTARQARIIAILEQHPVRSQSELAELLMAIADEVPASGPAHDAWQQALSRISSDLPARRTTFSMLVGSDVAKLAVMCMLSNNGVFSPYLENTSLKLWQIRWAVRP